MLFGGISSGVLFGNISSGVVFGGISSGVHVEKLVVL